MLKTDPTKLKAHGQTWLWFVLVDVIIKTYHTCIATEQSLHEIQYVVYGCTVDKLHLHKYSFQSFLWSQLSVTM